MESKDDMAKFVEELNDKFGKAAVYKEISFVQDNTVGTMITLTVTDKPTENKMEQYTMTKGVWEKTADINMEISEGAKLTDFTFPLSEVDLTRIPDLCKQSVSKIEADKKMTNMTASMVGVVVPDRIGDSRDEILQYTVQVQPKTGGSSFTVFFDKNGKLKEVSE